ncbi:MAG: BrnT family toxin [Phaeodactylibacter sp.]|nr:BrnT family toxin [Phaeodactylibacter sp.]
MVEIRGDIWKWMEIGRNTWRYVEMGRNRNTRKRNGAMRKREHFDDPDRIQYINSLGNERRFITIGKVIKFIIAVVYTIRSGLLRIISARQARKRELIHDFYSANQMIKGR